MSSTISKLTQTNDPQSSCPGRCCAYGPSSDVAVEGPGAKLTEIVEEKYWLSNPPVKGDDAYKRNALSHGSPVMNSFEEH